MGKSMADPTKPYPGGYKLPIKWAEERIQWWAEARELGIQYYANGKAVYCLTREDQWVADT